MAKEKNKAPNPLEKAIAQIKEADLPKPFTIGVVCNKYNYADILFYKEEFRLIDKIFKDKVQVIFVGYDPDEANNALEGISYSKKVSLNHWPKHLRALGIDLLFIPLQPTAFNIHSEDIKKFIESAREKVPIMTVNQYPYNAIINNGVNGFLYESKEMFIEYLKNILENHMDRVPIAGLGAMELVDTYFSLPETETSPENLKTCTSNLIELINADY